jgi:hypothetical protein
VLLAAKIFPTILISFIDMRKSSSSLEVKEVLKVSDYRELESRGTQDGVVNERHLVRKIDLHILPVLCSVYFLQFMDKVILNYANVMGIQPELHMTGNEFSWAGTSFFLGYMLAEFPQGMFTSLLVSVSRSPARVVQKDEENQGKA